MRRHAFLSLRRRYATTEGLLDALKGDTVFVSAKWLRTQRRGAVLPPRADMPRGALLMGAELKLIFNQRNQAFGRDIFPLVAVSHKWRTPSHPDPNGRTTARLQDYIGKKWRHFNKYHGFADVGIFYDWCCLWPSQNRVQSSTVWFAHAQTMVCFVTDEPGYADSGWNRLEVVLTGMLKGYGFDRMIEMNEMGNALGLNLSYPQPPDNPLAFYRGHRYGHLAYSKNGDRKIVAKHFETVAQDIYCGAVSLNFFKQEWQDVHAAKLGLVLPLCVSLVHLVLVKIKLTVTGFRAILEPTHNGALPALERLHIGWNQELKDEGIELLAATLEVKHVLQKLKRLDATRCDATKRGVSALKAARPGLAISLSVGETINEGWIDPYGDLSPPDAQVYDDIVTADLGEYPLPTLEEDGCVSPVYL